MGTKARHHDVGCRAWDADSFFLPFVYILSYGRTGSWRQLCYYVDDALPSMLVFYGNFFLGQVQLELFGELDWH